MNHCVTLGPGSDNADLDEINAFLANGQERSYDPKNDKRLVCAIPASGILHNAQQLKDDANALMKANQFEEAFEKYHRGIWMLMKGDENWNGDVDGVTKDNIGRGSGFDHLAKDDIKVAYESDPLRIALHSNLALCALKLKRWKAAQSVCEFITIQDATNSKAWYRLAQAYEGQCELTSAVRAINALLDADPNNAAAIEFRARLEHEVAREKQKEKKQFANMFSRISAECKGESLYNDEDTQSAQRRTRAERRQTAAKQGPRAEYLEVGTLTDAQRAYAQMRHQMHDEVEDFYDMCKDLLPDGVSRLHSKFMGGEPLQEVERMAELEKCCRSLDERFANRLHTQVTGGMPLAEAQQLACEQVIADHSKLMNPESEKQARQMLEEGKYDKVIELVTKTEDEMRAALVFASFTQDELSALSKVKDLVTAQASQQSVLDAQEEVKIFRETRIRSRLTNQGLQHLQEIEDGGATKEQVREFLWGCEKAAIDEQVRLMKQAAKSSDV